eukprot:15951682-Heterocapsa_arctica.AAC.1
MCPMLWPSVGGLPAPVIGGRSKKFDHCRPASASSQRAIIDMPMAMPVDESRHIAFFWPSVMMGSKAL